MTKKVVPTKRLRYWACGRCRKLTRNIVGVCSECLSLPLERWIYEMRWRMAGTKNARIIS